MMSKKSLQKILFLNLVIFVSCISSSDAFAQETSTQKLTAREIAQQTLPSTVSIVMANDKTDEIKSGSGFFVTENVVVTNYHVIENSNKGVAKIVGEDKIYEILGTVGIDEKNDLALIKLKGAKGKPLKFNTDDKTAIGDDVYAVGNPQGLEGTFSQGIVSSFRRTNNFDLLQITAPISEGSSGGAVLNNKAEVIGIAVGGIERGQSLNFAIPVKFLRVIISNQTSIKILENSKFSSDKIPSNSKVAPQKTNDLPNKRNTPKQPSRISYKIADLEEENFVGSINLVKETEYEPFQKFGKLEFGKPTVVTLKKYNLDGNLDSIEAVVYSDTVGKEFRAHLFLLEIDGEKLERPVTYKKIYFYEYQNNLVTYDIYFRCNGCSNFQLIQKFSVKYFQDEESRFDSDGRLFLKTVKQRDNQGKLIEDTYNGDGTLSRREITYKTKMGEVSEYWKPTENKAQIELHSKTIVEETQGKVKETYLCIKETDESCNSFTISDKSSKIILSKKYGKESYKYEYTFDSKGNWTKKTELQQVSKFGKTYFEPVKVWIREINYN